MPDWVLIVVIAVSGLGGSGLIGYAFGEAARERRMRAELFDGWWRVGDGEPDP